MIARRLLSALALLLVPAPAFAAVDCGGVDLLAKARAEHPEKYGAFEQAARAVPNGEGLLWRIEAKGVAPSYLFGTMHTTEADLVALSEPVKAALGEADAVAVEIADANGAEAQAQMLAYVTQHGVDVTGGGLAGLTPAQAELVEKRLGEAGMPASVATMLKPWFLAITLDISSCELRKMGEGRPTIDARVEKIARDAGKPVVGLETVIEQLDAISKISDDTARRMIRDSVAKPSSSDDIQATTLALYRARRVGWYYAMKEDLFGAGVELSSYADFVDAVVDRRNQLMAERSRPLLDKGGALIAVGALHLPGEKGLVDLLRREGYAVTRVW